MTPERRAAIRAKLEEGTYGYYFDIVGWREANDDVRGLLQAYDQITLEREKGERVFQAVVYAFEGKEVPEDLLNHGMVRRAMKHREAAEAALVVLTKERDELQERCRAISYVSHDQADALVVLTQREQRYSAALRDIVDEENGANEMRKTARQALAGA